MKSVSDKARKIIRNKRIRITEVKYPKIKAVVQGDHGTYKTEIFRDGRFNCQCEGFIYTKTRGAECSHILAIKMHPAYAKWYPMKIVNEDVIIDENLKSIMPKFDLEPRDLEENRKISEDLINAIEEAAELSEMDKFILRKRWIDMKTYDEIIKSVKSTFNTDVSRRYITNIARKDPREQDWGDEGENDTL